MLHFCQLLTLVVDTLLMYWSLLVLEYWLKILDEKEIRVLVHDDNICNRILMLASILYGLHFRKKMYGEEAGHVYFLNAPFLDFHILCHTVNLSGYQCTLLSFMSWIRILGYFLYFTLLNHF
ncbi:hypothetical protein ACH5RR_009039 [Cinchona calisaya]|uniref:Uncharacterized protein n=1 Tax=Cinchona calisaya TaxID=153742 RepID=A0ABD3AG33_9GENT